MSAYSYQAKKPIMLYNVAVMESPRNGRVDTYRGSDLDSNLDAIDAVHMYGNGRTPFQAPTVNGSGGGHDLVFSPLHSVAPTTATTGTTHKAKYRVLGTLSLTAIVWSASCGGPVGSESLISAGGPLIGLLGILLYLLFCVVPLALMVTELSCAFPENGGYSVWAMTAFGPYWGFQVGYWSWVARVTNNAIYPGFIYSTITDGYGIEATSSAVAFFIKVAIALVLAVPSYLGVRFVGIGALVLLVLISLSTLLFTVWGFADGENAWFRLAEVRAADQTTSESADGGIDWVLLVHSLFWNFDGLYDISVIGGEVINPARTFPRVVLLAVVLTVLTYLLPLTSAVTADKMPWIEFVEDSLTDIAEAIGGSALHQITITSSVLSSIAMFSCTLFFQTFLVQGMAQSRLLPSVLRKRHARFKTPQYALLLSLLPTLVLLGFDFESILSMTNAFSGAVQMLIVLSMLQLRRAFPYIPRPMKMPGNLAVVSVVLVPAVVVFGFLIITTLIEWDLALVVVGFTVPGLLFPFVRQRVAGRRGCC